MHRIYLDWNVISNLKKSPNEHYKALAELLENYRQRLWIPYSVAHLRDLGRGYDAVNPDKVRYTYRDLGYLLHLTRGNCLMTDLKQSKPRRGWRDPFEFFESLQEDQLDESTTYAGFMSVLKTSTTPEVAALGGELASLLESAPMPYLENATPLVDKMFPNWRELQTMAGIIQDMYAMIDRMQQSHVYLQELRAEIDAQMPMLSPGVVSSAAPTDAFTRIDQLLAPLLGGKSLFAMMAESDSNAKPKTELDNFTNSYFSLDMLGYKREKLSAKNHFPNILDDMTHAYLAGHCDYFVAEDKTLRAKAAAVYAKKGVLTKICTVEQVVEELTDRLQVAYTAGNFFKILSDAVTEAVQADRLMPNIQPDAAQAQYYFLGWLFLDRFNTVRVEQSSTFAVSFQFVELKLTYADSIMTEELADLVAMLVNCLGVDRNGQALLHRSEWPSFGDGTWKGRRWDYEQVSLIIRLNEALGLTFEYLTTAPTQPEEPAPSAPARPNWVSGLWQRVSGQR